ncbi:MAG: hypothetical protein OEQ53_12500 [Saprospiraceae bacterium]|nr:hypothetical protein [Saprospiraceae bacterium]
MSTREKSLFDRIQAILTILTPILVAVVGFWLTRSDNKIQSAQEEIQVEISRIESSIKGVEAMKPFMEMMADTVLAKSKMAAYALYMLTKEDPQMAASIIMVKPELKSVLLDLSKRDTAMRDYLWEALVENVDERQGEGDIENHTQEIIDQIAKVKVNPVSTESSSNGIEGWCYLGNFRNMDGIRIEQKTIPAAGEEHTLLSGTNLREDKPQPPSYRMAKVIDIAEKGERIKIVEVDVDRKKQVWAKVKVISG